MLKATRVIKDLRDYLLWVPVSDVAHSYDMAQDIVEYETLKAYDDSDVLLAAKRLHELDKVLSKFRRRVDVALSRKGISAQYDTVDYTMLRLCIKNTGTYIDINNLIEENYDVQRHKRLHEKVSRDIYAEICSQCRGG